MGTGASTFIAPESFILGINTCWHRLAVCAVVPQVERENFSITPDAHCGRPELGAVAYVYDTEVTSHGAEVGDQGWRQDMLPWRRSP
jgi:hypothetical protein